MTADDFKLQIINAGVASVEQHEHRPSRYRGCLRGFRIAKTLTTPQEFITIIDRRHQAERRLSSAHADPERYWEYRCATAQIEFVWERMKIAWNLPKPWSGRAFIQYATIVGVKHE